jgi:hypothetical protein
VGLAGGGGERADDSAVLAAGARSASPIRKKTSHIRVTLTDEKPSRKK